MEATPFSGRESLRIRGERARLGLTLLFLPLSLGVVGFFFQNALTLRSLVLILIGALLYTALSRGRFLGGGVRIREGQFEHVYAVVAECARTIGVAPPHVFVRDDPFVPIVAIGTGQPYALVISASWIELFKPDELRFVVGRELAHIAAGHTRLTSLLSANGRENAVVAVAFGAWLRAIEYTADRAGLLCCGSLNAAFSAIAVSTFQNVGRKIDLHTFAEQRRELDAEPALRMGEWLTATPYATNRIAALAAFARDPLFQTWSQRFAQRRDAPAPPAAGAEDERKRYAGPGRRIAAFAIDFAIISALVPRTSTAHSAEAKRALAEASPAVAQAVNGVLGDGKWVTEVQIGDGLVWLLLAAYVVVLVAFAGQTLGMMICDLRVVGERRERVGLGRALMRYACLFASLGAIVGLVSLFRRVQPFETWSRTRLVSGSTGGRA
ncbi:MAG: hypothetical protein QOI11_2607 [Candidatus Eremiobacteraeota bacterium]|nr:hypothetical protein [Candidatus Eremiobacteraeota bacterium]